MPDPKVAASEMYQTLKLGAIAVTAFWKQIPQGETIMAAHRVLRPIERKLALEPKPGFKDPENLRRQLASGGFDMDNIKVERFVSLWLLRL